MWRDAHGAAHPGCPCAHTTVPAAAQISAGISDSASWHARFKHSACVQPPPRTRGACPPSASAPGGSAPSSVASAPHGGAAATSSLAASLSTSQRATCSPSSRRRAPRRRVPPRPRVTPPLPPHPPPTHRLPRARPHLRRLALASSPAAAVAACCCRFRAAAPHARTQPRRAIPPSPQYGEIVHVDLVRDRDTGAPAAPTPLLPPSVAASACQSDSSPRAAAAQASRAASASWRTRTSAARCWRWTT